MQEWCGKWQIHIRLSDLKGEDSILDGLHNLCNNTKMFAIASVAQLARHHAKIKSSKTSLEPGLPELKSTACSSCPLIEVTDEMLDAVEKLLEDSTEHVCVPAAVVLYCMDKQSEKVLHVYHYTRKLMSAWSVESVNCQVKCVHTCIRMSILLASSHIHV